MPRYHVSSDGTPRVCNAQQGNCPLSEDDGSPTPHGDFADAKEASAFAESVNVKRYGGSFPTVAGGLDKTKVAPAYDPSFGSGVYREAKQVADSPLKQGLYSLDAYEYDMPTDDYQEFKDSGGDYGDSPLTEMSTLTQTFNDAGELESSNETFERAVFADAAMRENEAKYLLGDDEGSELISEGQIIHEEWKTPNTRVTYRVTTYDNE